MSTIVCAKDLTASDPSQEKTTAHHEMGGLFYGSSPEGDCDRLLTDQPKRPLSSAMRMPEAADIESEPIRVGIELREVDLD